MTLYIGLSGKKQVGKDTAGQAIQNCLPEALDVAKTSFAHALKQVVCVDLLNIDRDLVFGDNEAKNQLTHIMWDDMFEEIRKEYSITEESWPNGAKHDILRSGPMTVREVLQVIGTDWFRRIYSNVWVNYVFTQFNDRDVVIITDTRFFSELHEIEKCGIILRLTRNTGLVDEHESETQLDNYNFQFEYDNNGTIEDLNNFIHHFVEREICPRI